MTNEPYNLTLPNGPRVPRRRPGIMGAVLLAAMASIGAPMLPPVSRMAGSVPTLPPEEPKGEPEAVRKAREKQARKQAQREEQRIRSMKGQEK